MDAMHVGRPLLPLLNMRCLSCTDGMRLLYYTDAQMVRRGIRRSWSVLGIRSMPVWTLNQGESICPLILLVFYCLYKFCAYALACRRVSQLLHVLMAHAHEQVKNSLQHRLEAHFRITGSMQTCTGYKLC